MVFLWLAHFCCRKAMWELLEFNTFQARQLFHIIDKIKVLTLYLVQMNIKYLLNKKWVSFFNVFLKNPSLWSPLEYLKLKSSKDKVSSKDKSIINGKNLYQRIKVSSKDKMFIVWLSKFFNSRKSSCTQFYLLAFEMKMRDFSPENFAELVVILHTYPKGR